MKCGLKAMVNAHAQLQMGYFLCVCVICLVIVVENACTSKNPSSSDIFLREWQGVWLA